MTEMPLVTACISEALEKALLKAWHEKHGPYSEPETYPVAFSQFCEERLASLLTSIKE